MNKLIYEKIFTLTNGMFDEKGSIKPYAILDLFQRIAGDHADELGCGTAYCDEHNYGWILARQECYIYNSPKPQDQIQVITFPHKPGLIDFKREYIIKSLTGSIIAHGCALWVLVDLNTHKIIRTNNIYPEGEYITETLFPGKITKPISIKEKGIYIDNYKVTKSDIDIYHHMNNAKYAEVMFDYASLDAKDIKYFAVCYHNEIKEKESMSIFKQIIDHNIYITGCNNEKIIFTSVLGGTNEIN